MVLQEEIGYLADSQQPARSAMFLNIIQEYPDESKVSRNKETSVTKTELSVVYNLNEPASRQRYSSMD